jgi:putative DNA primase/helicase
MTFDEIVGRLENVRPCAGGVTSRCPAHDDRQNSLSVTKAPDRTLLHCFASCTVEGICAAMGIAVRDLFFGSRHTGADVHHNARPSMDQSDVASAGYARRIWRDAKPATGTTVERYLRLRGITCPPPPSIRFAIGRHAPSQTGPWAIMVAAVQNLAGEIVAIHRTFLTGDGRKAPVEPVKMALGPIRGRAVRLAPAGETLALAEGIETALSVHQATGIATWAALGTANLARVELPTFVRQVIICADNDANGAGEKAALAAAAKLTREGCKVQIARPPGASMDFNDLLRA